MKHYTRLTKTNRIQIETMYKEGRTARYIADFLGKHISCIYYELKRGFYMRLNSDYTYTKTYSADKAHNNMLFEKTTKGAQLKIGNDYEFVRFVEEKIIKEKMSPDAVLGFIRDNNLHFKTKICKTTFYKYIENGIFPNLTNKHLLIKSKKKKKAQSYKNAKRGPRGKSIEQRDKEILSREEFGHWELDTVIGKRVRDAVLFVLTERKTRYEIIIKAKDKTSRSCIQVLNKLERRYGKHFRKVFKSITCDNGTEFSDYIGMEKSIYGGKRTSVFFCHPYSSYERGSNENQNRFIRRFIPKGTLIGPITTTFIQSVEEYINNYPRKILSYSSSQKRFSEELKKFF